MSTIVNLKQRISHYRIKSKVKSILWITFTWTLISLFRFFETHASQINSPNYQNNINLIDAIVVTLLIIIPAGIIIGSNLVFLWERWLRKMPYFKAMFFILIFFTCVFLIFYPIDYLVKVINNPDELIDNSIWKTVFIGSFNLVLLSNYLFWLTITLMTILFLFIRDKFGPVEFVNFLKGKYLRPKREERVFMFTDLKSSTAIAERLGEERYFNFLNDTFSIATPGILATKGEIYQYVGDEIVISWILKNGLSKANCINCFYKMTSLLKDKSDYFEKKYQTQPEFKAGLHFGHVITGEMGIVKREIVYSGDVLNTASRIQSICNKMNVDILISNELVKKIKQSYIHRKIKVIGNINLRGKQEKIELITLLSTQEDVLKKNKKII